MQLGQLEPQTAQRDERVGDPALELWGLGFSEGQYHL